MATPRSSDSVTRSRRAQTGSEIWFSTSTPSMIKSPSGPLLSSCASLSSGRSGNCTTVLTPFRSNDLKSLATIEEQKRWASRRPVGEECGGAPRGPSSTQRDSPQRATVTASKVAVSAPDQHARTLRLAGARVCFLAFSLSGPDSTPYGEVNQPQRASAPQAAFRTVRLRLAPATRYGQSTRSTGAAAQRSISRLLFRCRQSWHHAERI